MGIPRQVTPEDVQEARALIKLLRDGSPREATNSFARALAARGGYPLTVCGHAWCDLTRAEHKIRRPHPFLEPKFGPVCRYCGKPTTEGKAIVCSNRGNGGATCEPVPHRCNHKFVDGNNCAKCGKSIDELRG